MLKGRLSCLLLVWFLGVSWPALVFGQSDSPVQMTWQEKLGKLEQSLQRLKELYLKQGTELTSSRESLKELKSEVSDLKSQSEELQKQLQESKADSKELGVRLTASLKEIGNLQEFLRISEEKLISASASFQIFQSQAERRIQELETRNQFLTVVGIGGGIVGVAGIIYGLIRSRYGTTANLQIP